MPSREDLARRIVEVLLDDATDRRGWRQEWERFDDDAQIEIRQEWLRLVELELSRASSEEI